MVARAPGARGEVAIEIGERTVPAEVEEDLLEGLAEAAAGRVVAAVDRRVGVDVLGRHRGTHEDQVVVGVGAVEHPRDHRVEERLGELGLQVVDQQADVGELRLLPGLDPERLDVELGADAIDAFGDPLVVEPDPLLNGRWAAVQAAASKCSLASALVARNSR